jgi:hypothetical protein
LCTPRTSDEFDQRFVASLSDGSGDAHFDRAIVEQFDDLIATGRRDTHRQS